MHDMLAPLGLRLAWMVVLVVAGYGFWRIMGWGTARSDKLSQWIIDGLFPCLVLSQLSRTLEWHDLGRLAELSVAAGWMTLATGALGGWLWFRRGWPGEPRSAIYCAVMPNWIFLPLAIAEPVYGPIAVQTVILFNIPMQVLLWTAGVRLVRGRLQGIHPLRTLLTNPGLLATAAGIGLGLGLPTDSPSSSTGGILLEWILTGVGWVGATTVPVSLIALGTQLAALRNHDTGSKRGMAMIVGLRLGVFPVIAGLGLMGFAALTPWVSDPVVRHTVYLIAAMPVAVSAPLFLVRFGRDAALGARAVVISTILSVVTVLPVVLLLVWLDGLLLP